MRTLLWITAALPLLVGFAAALRAEEEPSALEVAKQTLREQQLTIQLLEKRVSAQESLAQALFDRLERDFETLRALRGDKATGVGLLKRRIRSLQDDLEAERERNGVDEDALGRQLIREQERHMKDVMQLQDEVARANDMAEENRVEATEILQREVVAKEEQRRLRDHFVHAIRLLGEVGPAAKAALPWLKQTEAWDDDVLARAARTATARIQGTPEER